MAGDITRRANIIFDADTSRAQTRIQQLAQSLQQAINFGVESSGVTMIDKQLQNATNDAIKLQAQLQQAVNVNTGKLDLTKFTQSLKQGQTSLQQYHNSLMQLGSSGQAAFANLARSIATAEAPMQRVSNVLAQMGTTLKNTIKWNISSSIINGFVGSIQSAFNYAEKLNASLNAIQIVTGESTAQMAKFAEQANRSAQILSTTTRAYTDAALIFYQQGLGDADVKARTDAVIKMANVTGDASKEVSNYMTAIWNNFDNGTTSLEAFEDKIVALGATTASSSAEIAAGLEKFAAIGNTIGLSFDYAAAALSTVVAETRQSADTVGTAFRTLFSRLQGLKLGETLEDGTTLNKYSAALAAVGVQIKDASGQLKSMDTILNDLAANWNNLDRAQQTALAQTVGGARQYTTLISLMENWDQFQKNLRTEANSEGELGKQAEIYAQSWEAAKARVTAAMESIYSTLIDDQFFINANNGLAKMLDGINSVIKGMGGVSGLLSRLGAVALTVFEDQIANSLRNLMTNLELFTTKGQEKMRAIQAETVSMMQSVGGNTTGGKIVGDAYTKEAEIQGQILQQSAKLSAVDQGRIATLQKIVQARTDENAKLGQTVDDVEKLYNRQTSGAAKAVTEIEKLKGALDSITINDTMSGTQLFDQIKKNIEDINFAAQDRDALRQYFDAFNGAETAEARLEALKTAMASGIQGGHEAAGAMQGFNNVLQKVADGSMTAEQGLNTVNRIFSQHMPKAANNSAVSIEHFNNNIDTLINKANETGNTQLGGWLATLKASTNGSVSSFEELQSALTKVTGNSHDAENAIRLIKQVLGEASTASLDLATQMVKFGQILTSFVSIINQLIGLYEIWTDEEASLGKKLLTTVSAVGMLLPLLATMMRNIGLLIPGFLGVSVSAEAASTGIVAASTSITLFGRTIKLTFPALAIITAAITALVVGIIALREALKPKPEYTLKDQLNDITEAANETRTALEKLNSVISDLTSTKTEYDELRTSLDNCKEGTTEWYDALEKVEAKGTEILTKFPVISKVLQNPALYFGDDFNIADLYDSETGMIDFSRILARVIERNEQYQDELVITEGVSTWQEQRTAAQVAYNDRRDTTSVVATDGTDMHIGGFNDWFNPFSTSGRGFGDLSSSYDWQSILDGTQTVVDGSIILANSYRDLITTAYDNERKWIPESTAAEWASNMDSSWNYPILELSLGEARNEAMGVLAAEFGHANDYGGTSETGDPGRFLNELTTSMMNYGVEHGLSNINEIIDQYFSEPEHQALLPIYMAAVTGDERYFKATYAGIEQFAIDNNTTFSGIKFKSHNNQSLGTLAYTGYTGEYGQEVGPLWDTAHYTLMQQDYSNLTAAEQYDYTALTGAATHIISHRDDLTTGEATFARQALPRAWTSEDSELLSIFDNVDFTSKDYLDSVASYLQWLETVDMAFQGYNLNDWEIDGNMIRLTKGEGDNEETYEFNAYRPLVHDLTESVGDEMIDTVVQKYRSWAPEIQAIATANGYKELTKQEYDTIMNDSNLASQFSEAASALGWQELEYQSEFSDDRYRDIGEGSTGKWLSTLTNKQNEIIDSYDADLAERMWAVLEKAEDVSTYFTETGDLNFEAFGNLGSEIQARSRDTQSFIDLATSWESITAILDKLDQGKAITGEELAELEYLIGPVSDYLELTGDGFGLIDGQMGALSAQALSQMSIMDNSIQNLQNTSLDFSNDSWKNYIDFLEMLGYSAETIQTYIDTGNTEALEQVQTKVEELLGADLSAYEIDDQFVYKLLNYADSITEVSTILEQWNKNWSDINITQQRAILKNLGITDEAALKELTGEVDFSQVTAAFSSQDTQTALDNFIGAYSSYITDDMKDQLYTWDDNVLNVSTRFTDLKQKIADLLGVSVDLITNEWLRANWADIQALGSGNYEVVSTSLSNLANSFNEDVVSIITDGLDYKAAYVTGNLITSSQKNIKRTVSQGVAELNKLVNTITDETFLTQLQKLNAADIQKEIDDPNSFLGPTLIEIQQMIADLLGIDDIDQVEAGLIKEWASNGTLTDLVTGGKSSAALSIIAGDMGIEDISTATRLLDIMGPQAAPTSIGTGITGLQGSASSLRSGNLYNLLSSGNLSFDDSGAMTVQSADFYQQYMTEFNELKEALAALLNLNIDNISDAQIQDWFNEGLLNSLISGNANQAQTGYSTLYRQTHDDLSGMGNASDIGAALATVITPDQVEELTNTNTQAVVNAFASRDFSNITQGRLEKAIASFASLDVNGIIENGDNDLYSAGLIEKQIDAMTGQEFWDVSETARQMGYFSVSELVNGLQIGAQNALDSLDLDLISQKLGETLGPAVQSALTVMSEHGILTSSDVANVTTTLQNAQSAGGTASLNMVSNLLATAGDNAGYLASQLSGVDWQTVTVEELTKILDIAGVDTSNLSFELDYMISMMQAATSYTSELSAALQNYANNKDLADKLRNGETLNAEEMENYIQMLTDNTYGGDRLQAEQYIADNFVHTLEGWKPLDGVDVKQLAAVLETSISNGFDNGVIQASNASDIANTATWNGYNLWSRNQEDGFDDMWGLFSTVLTKYFHLQDKDLALAQGYISALQKDEIRWDDFKVQLNGLLGILDMNLPDFMAMLQTITSIGLEEAQELQSSANTTVDSLDKAYSGLDTLTSTYGTTADSKTALLNAQRASSSGRTGMTTAQKASANELYSILGDILGITIDDENFQDYQPIAIKLLSGDAEQMAAAFAEIDDARIQAGLAPLGDASNAWLTTLINQYRDAAEQTLIDGTTAALTGEWDGQSRSAREKAKATFEAASNEEQNAGWIGAGYLEADGVTLTSTAQEAGYYTLDDLRTATAEGFANGIENFPGGAETFKNYLDGPVKDNAIKLWDALADVAGSEISEADNGKIYQLAENLSKAGINVDTFLGYISQLGEEYFDEVVNIFSGVDWTNFDTDEILTQLAAAGININDLPEGLMSWLTSLITEALNEDTLNATDSFMQGKTLSGYNNRQMSRIQSSLSTDDKIYKALEQQGYIEYDSEEGWQITAAGRELGYKDAAQAHQAIIDGMDAAMDSLDPKAYTEHLTPILRDSFTSIMDLFVGKDGESLIESSDLSNVSNLLNKARELGGMNGVNVMSSMIKNAVNAGNNIQDVINAFSSIDWSNIDSATDLQNQLELAGLNTSGWTGDIEALITAMQNAAQATTALSEALQAYSDAADIADSLMKDGTISAEQAKQLEEEYGREYVDDRYSQRADGRMVLRDNTEENRAMEASGLLQGAEDNFTHQQQMYSGVASDFLAVRGLSIKPNAIHGMSQEGSRGLASAQFVTSRGMEAGFSNAVTDELIKINEGLNSDVLKERELALQSLKELETTNQEFADWVQLNIDNAQSEALRSGDAATSQDELTASQMFTSAKPTNMQELETTADEITKVTGTQAESTDAYNEALLNLAEGYDTCADEAAAFKEALESGNKEEQIAAKRALKAAMAQEDYAKEMTRSSKAIKTSIKAMDDLKDEYGDAAEGFVEYKKEVSSVQKELNKLFGTNKISEKFVTEHLDDINAMAQGDEEAFQRIQDAVEQEYGPIHIEVDDSEALAALGETLNLADYVADIPDLEINVNGYADMDQLVQDIAQALAQAQDLLDANGNIMMSAAGNIAGQVSGLLSDAMEGYTVSVELAGTQSIKVGEDSVTTWTKTGSTTLNAGANPDGSQRTVSADNATATTRVTPITEERPVFKTKVEKDGGYDSNPYKGTSSGSPSRGRGGGGCFEAGTLITTINGYKNIEDIQIGDIVLSYNEKLQKNEYSQVLETMIHVVVGNIYTLYIKDDALVVTGIHRFFVKRRGRTMWISASNLHVNDLILFADGTWHLIEAIDIEFKASVVYNFEVSNNHNYYVGKNRILAHNKGGGGGGGRREDQKGDRKRKEQRYVTNTNQLEDLQDNLDKINKAEERSYGRNRIKQMQDKVKALDALAKKQHDLYEEAVAYQKQDQNDLLNNELAKAAGITWEFDENGTILNRDDIEQKMVDYYNSFTKDKNKDGEYILKDNTEAGAVAFKNMQEAYSELEELIDKYDESQDKVKEYWQEYLDSINEMYDTVVEMATYKVEVQVEVSDEALKIIDFMLMQIEDDAYKAADAITKMGMQAREYMNQNTINNSGIRDLFNHHDGVAQYADDNGVLHNTTDLRGIVDGLMNNEVGAWEELMKHEEEFTANEIDAIQNMIDANLEAAENMAQLQEDMYATISDTFDSLSEDMDRYIEQIDHLRQVTENYTNIVDIIGKKHLGITNELMAETNLAQVDQDINRVIATRSKYLHQQEMMNKLQKQFANINDNTMTASQRDLLQQMSADETLDAATRQRYAAMAQNPNAQLTDRDVQFLKEQMQHVQDEIDASQEDFMQSWEDALSSIADWYTKKMEGVIEDVSDKLAGSMSSLQELADQFEKSDEMQSQYLEDFERIYELSKLNRDIVNSIDETDNVKAKQALAELQAEINQMDEDNVELTRYQIENARRRYELTLAQLALEESKNAKSQVQMSRSATGEWSYVYTADESQVEEAEQNYEDKLYAMQRANADYINELQQNIVDLQERMLEEIEALRVEDFASAEEYYAKVQEIKDYYGNLMDINLDNLNIVFGEQERLYTDDWTIYSEMTGYKISEDERYIDKWNETALAKLTGFETMEEFHQNFNDASQEMLDESNEAYDLWEQKTEDAMEAAGTSIEGYREVMDEEVAAINDDSASAADSIEDLGEVAVEAFDKMTEAVSNWQAEYSATVDDMLQKNEALALSFNKLLKEWSGYNDTVGLDDSTGTNDDDNTEGPENPGGPPANEGNDEPDSAMEKTEKYKKAIAFAIWTHSSSGWGHGNSSKKLTSGDRYNRLKEKGLVPDVVQQQINKYRGKSTAEMQADTGIKFKWADKDKALKPYTYRGFSFDTGGYTGEWSDGDGRLAVLHSKEIVLNKEDTENFLSGIEILRDITKAIDLNALASAGYMSSMANVHGINGMGALEQEVHITAEFPNATDKDSIKEAFDDLINLASQYANRK